MLIFIAHFYSVLERRSRGPAFEVWGLFLWIREAYPYSSGCIHDNGWRSTSFSFSFFFRSIALKPARVVLLSCFIIFLFFFLRTEFYGLTQGVSSKANHHRLPHKSSCMLTDCTEPPALVSPWIAIYNTELLYLPLVVPRGRR